jgi:hypothetical protein
MYYIKEILDAVLLECERMHKTSRATQEHRLSTQTCCDSQSGIPFIMGLFLGDSLREGEDLSMKFHKIVNQLLFFMECYRFSR